MFKNSYVISRVMVTYYIYVNKSIATFIYAAILNWNFCGST